MFSLIISIIAIALVAALALASIYYGGDAFTEGTAKATASSVINQGQQISAATAMAGLDEVNLAVSSGVAVLSPKYLKSEPKIEGVSWTVVDTDTSTFMNGGDFVEVILDPGTTIASEVCQIISEKADVTVVPTSRGATTFGCYLDPTNGSTAFYAL